jgi:hypothetical protein
MRDATPVAEHGASQRADISPEFRNGTLTAISVIVGFSLSFLSRWAGTPGKWHTADLSAITLIIVGTGLQILALAAMLFVSSLVAEKYARAIRLFLIGLVIVAVGVATAIFADIAGLGQNILGE